MQLVRFAWSIARGVVSFNGSLLLEIFAMVYGFFSCVLRGNNPLQHPATVGWIEFGIFGKSMLISCITSFRNRTNLNSVVFYRDRNMILLQLPIVLMP